MATVVCPTASPQSVQADGSISLHLYCQGCGNLNLVYVAKTTTLATLSFTCKFCGVTRFHR